MYFIAKNGQWSLRHAVMVLPPVECVYSIHV